MVSSPRNEALGMAVVGSPIKPPRGRRKAGTTIIAVHRSPLTHRRDMLHGRLTSRMRYPPRTALITL